MRLGAFVTLVLLTLAPSTVGDDRATVFDLVRPGPNEALVYFYRPKTIFPKFFATLYANGEKVAEVQSEEYTSVWLPPGEYVFTSYELSKRRKSDDLPQPSLLFNKAYGKVEIRGQVRGGQVYFLEWNETVKFEYKIIYNQTTYQWSLRHVPAPEAKTRIKGCQWVKPTVERVTAAKDPPADVAGSAEIRPKTPPARITNLREIEGLPEPDRFRPQRRAQSGIGDGMGAFIDESIRRPKSISEHLGIEEPPPPAEPDSPPPKIEIGPRRAQPPATTSPPANPPLLDQGKRSLSGALGQ